MKKESIRPKKRFEPCPITKTLSGIPIQKLYSPENTKEINYQRDLGNPGEYPFTRGIWGDMYRGKLWTKRVFTGLGLPSDTNKRWKYLIEHGETGLYWQSDAPTGHGLDADHPLGEYNAGVTGISFCMLRDFYDYFDGISPEEISLSQNTPTMAGPVIYAGFITYAKDMGYDLKKLSGSFINEYLFSALTMFNIGHFPEELSVKLSTDVIEHSIKNTPKLHPLAPNPYNLADFGANVIQEIAFTVAIIREYIDRMIDRGYNIDDFAPRVNVFGCSCDIDLFEEIAKFRATRMLWAKLMKEKYKAKNPKSMRLYLSAHTEGDSLTVVQPVNNIIRITLQSLACVLGGLQSFDPCGYAEPHHLLTEAEALTCLNIHHILSHETGVAATADPLGGSYYIEWMTSKIEEEMWKLVDEMEKRGGALKAIGWMREELVKESKKRQEELETKERYLIGVNEFIVPKEREVKIDMEKYRPQKGQIKVAEERANQVRKFKAKRDKNKTKSSLENLRSEAEKGEKHNLIPVINKALRADATLGEIIGVIRMANGYDYDPYKMIKYPF
jgi:methylmalonyl-CoA mutase N-terminal domain/subunit